MSTASAVDCKKVAAALAEIEQLPKTAAAMLTAGLPTVVRPEGDLHPYQLQLVELVTKQLAGEQQRLVDARVDVETRSSEAVDMQAELQSASDKAVETQDRARLDLEEKIQFLRQEAEKVESEQAEHEATIGRHELAKVSVTNTKKRKEEVCCIMDDSLKKCVEGAWGNKRIKKDECVYEVDQWIAENNDDPVLVVAAAAALNVEASKRSDFDRAVVQGLVDAFDIKNEQFATGVSKAMTQETLASQEALGAWAVWDLARERHAEATAMHVRANEAKEEADANMEAANDKLVAQDQVIRNLSAQRELVEEKKARMTDATASLVRLSTAGSYPADEAAASAVAGTPQPKVGSPQTKRSPQMKPEVTSPQSEKVQAEKVGNEQPAAVASVLLGA